MKVLESHGIKGKPLNWIREWLSDRVQKVVIEGHESVPMNVTSGVPQGSVLGPLLFIVYINVMDIELDVGLAEILSKFADDTKVGSIVDNEQQQSHLQTALDQLSLWANKWQMMFNESKCKVLHFGTRNKKYHYSLNQVQLEESVLERDIGVNISNDLKPSSHVDIIVKKANSMLGQLSRAFSFKNKAIWTRLYKTYVRPLLEYSPAAWSPWNQADIEKLEKVQERALKQCSELNNLSYNEKLQICGLTSLHDRRIRADHIQVWKILNRLDDVPEDTWFTRYREEDRRTRNRTDQTSLRIPNHNREVRRNFFSIRAASAWNQLPTEVRNQPSLTQFKSSLDTHTSTGARMQPT